MDWHKNRLIIAAALLIGLLAVSLASAQSSAPTQISACVRTGGVIRILGANETCLATETPLTWNVTGPQGPQGPQGEPGPAGGPRVPNQVVVGKISIDGVVTNLEILGYQWGVQQEPDSSSTGGSAGKASFDNFTVVTELNAASPQLLLSTASGRHQRWATVVIFRPGSSDPAMTYQFTDVLLASVHDTASGIVGDPALETVSFGYATITETFTSTHGTTSAGWDLIGNRPVP